ncbi:MAG: S-adenosylmethionine:tRNA ribosyltransferase-isomerase [Frankiaceae bacterium]|nr:S-adenosylmethionine:tRNA ribosyltransferase-isomerase [Frankiaceae bacterium]MBV9871501.1 S-adenosylmethionine:tRNA ribosyltransferase-isomerase [Frankiaceae bacterium]
MRLATPGTRFTRLPGSDADRPPEARGIARDQVRLLVSRPSGITHAAFAELGDYVEAGDLLVVNNSATIAAAVDGRRRGEPIAVHFSTSLDDGSWVVELRPPGRATGHLDDVAVGDWIELPDGAGLLVRESFPMPGRAGSRLWRARVAVEVAVPAYLERVGRPIRYAYVPDPWPLAAYQTVFAAVPGSAEMASAARPFTTDLVTALVSRGIAVAPVTLHAGVSSAEAGEPPAPERYAVPAATAQLVNLTRANGRRVIAVGTTATRALETAAGATGSVTAATGWTDLVLGPERGTRVVDGIVTGWHDAGASHLLLLEAVAGLEVVQPAYAAAVASGYLWHEFGDSALLLRR